MGLYGINMLKVGRVYKTKKTIILYDGLATLKGFYVHPGGCFTVLEDFTNEEEVNEFHDYWVLYNGKKYYLNVRVHDWKVVSYDYELIC